MKKSSILTFLIILYSTSLFSNTIDSLLNLSKQTNDPEKLISYFTQIGTLLREPYPDSALVYYNKCLDLSNQINSDDYYCQTLGNIAVTWTLKNNLDTATWFIEKSMIIAKASDNNSALIEGYKNIGMIELQRLNYKKAISVFKTAASLINNQNENKLKSEIYNNLGISYKFIYNYDSALWYYLESLKISEQIGDDPGIGSTTNNIALIYEKLEKYDLSIKYLERSLAIRQDHNNLYGQALVYNNLGLIYEDKNQHEKALDYFKFACHLMQQMGQKDQVAICYNNMGSVYITLKDFKKADQYLTRALNINTEIGNEAGLATTFANLADFYKEIRNYYKAIIHYKKCYSLAVKINDISLITRCYDGLFYSFEQQGIIDSALSYYKSLVTLKDSISNQESRRKVEVLEIEYQTLKKEKENQSLTKENEINKARLRQGVLAFILLAVFSGFAVILSIITLHNRNKIKKAMDVISEQNSEIHQQSQELKQAYLKMKSLSRYKEDLSGMIVHDLKNPINTIINIADTIGNNGNAQLIKHSGKKMLNLVINILDVQRYEETGMELTRFDTELGSVLNRAIREVSYNAELNEVEIITPQQTDYIVNVDANVFERILVNLLTNAIKFAPIKTKIRIEFEEIGDHKLKIHILDKGPGIESTMLDRIFDKFSQAEKRNLGISGSTGIGLTFCKMAIESHGGKIGVNSRQGKGSDFWIKIAWLRKIVYDQPYQDTPAQTNLQELYLSYDAKEMLFPHVERLNEYLVYQISDIRKVINKLTQNNEPSVKKYTEELNNAVISCNDKRYRELINLVLHND